MERSKVIFLYHVRVGIAAEIYTTSAAHEYSVKAVAAYSLEMIELTVRLGTKRRQFTVADIRASRSH
jgi:hypothetical protein